MKISVKTGHAITGALVLSAILIPTSWYQSLLSIFWHQRVSTAFVDEHESLQEIINRGLLDYKKKRYEEAESNLREALELANRLYPKMHNRRAKTLHFLGMVLLEQGKTSEAVTILDEVVGIRTILMPAGDVSVLESLSALAEALYQDGNNVLAASTAQRIVAIADSHDNFVSSPVAEALVILSKCHIKKSNFQAARERYQKVLDIEKQLYGEISIPVVLAQFYIAGISASLGDYQEVDRRFEVCKTIVKSLPRPIDHNDLELLSDFMTSLSQIGLADKSADIRQILENLNSDLNTQDSVNSERVGS